MNKNPRTKDNPLAFRLPIDVMEVIRRRMAKSKRWDKPQEYIKDRIITDARRKR